MPSKFSTRKQSETLRFDCGCAINRAVSRRCSLHENAGTMLGLLQMVLASGMVTDSQMRLGIAQLVERVEKKL